MILEKNSDINFKFSVYQGKDLLIEKIFSAANFNPPTRYSVDIRGMIPSISNKLQSVLSKNSEKLEFNDFNLNLLDEYLDTYKLFSNNLLHSKINKPSEVEYNIGEKRIYGVPCRFGLYINDKPIVERDFYVRNYNPKSKLSFDLYDVISNIVININEYLVKEDLKNMWEDFDIINQLGFSIQQIRDMSRGKRNEMLRRIK